MNTRVLFVGCGAVAQCTLPILLKELKIASEHIVVMDFVDNRHRIADVSSRESRMFSKKLLKLTILNYCRNTSLRVISSLI